MLSLIGNEYSVKFVFFFKNILGAISLKIINDTCVNGKMVCYLTKWQ
jgi:hypothetical protein